MAAEDEYNLDVDKLYGSGEDVLFRIGLIVVPILMMYGFVKFVKFVEGLDPYLHAIIDFFIASYQYFFN